MLIQSQTAATKAKNLRYKKPIVSNMNLFYIKDQLYEIIEACEEIRWYTDSDDGDDSLVNALLGDEDEAYEFRMAFAELGAECEQMLYDLEGEWVPDCFDLLFVAAKSGDYMGGYSGYDSYEGDYFGISLLDEKYAEQESKTKLMRLKKEDLILAVQQCLKIYSSFISLNTRYDSLKAAIDILRDDNTEIIKVTKEINKLYEAAASTQTEYVGSTKGWIDFDKYLEELSQEMWLWQGKERKGQFDPADCIKGKRVQNPERTGTKCDCGVQNIRQRV